MSKPKWKLICIVIPIFTLTIIGLSCCSDKTSVTIEQTETINWDLVNDFAYQLEDIDLATIENSKFDLVIIDYSADGSESCRFSKNLIDDFYSKAIAKGYIPYATVRNLNKLTINSGYEPN